MNQQLVLEAIEMIKAGTINKMEIRDVDARTIVSRNKKSGNIKISVKEVRK